MTSFAAAAEARYEGVRPLAAMFSRRPLAPNVTTRGMGAAEMAVISDCMADLLEALAEDRGEAALEAVRERTQELTNRFPLPYALV